ncbi:MAG: hypothetical protein J5959_01110 [Butyrivibrio sp.]|uniref:DUF6017 domain-containing protein n=1 Tax=Butyrivibrio fibrisolvens TaxID=831 RepID=A0A1H9VIT8_BUTFI|nr:helix-turn-helix domain-containing protein [Butyrivibrio fibrisolvens]MBO5620212.1 hypothetical protein [Butyrivibrio sp.]SES21143.1 hypothetical protein SAMN04487884_12341 [Butyrivibrio fibrisolvens]
MSQITAQNDAEEQSFVFHCDTFTTVTNHCLEDCTLSLEARGLLVTMFSLKDDWQYSVAGLSMILPHCRDKINRVVNELEEHGYVKRERYRSKDGRFQFKYHIYDESQIYHDDNSGKRPQKTGKRPRTKIQYTDESGINTETLPHTEKQYTENPDTVNPDTEKQAQLKTNKQETDINILKSINQHGGGKDTTLPSTNQIDVIDMMDRKNEIRERLSEKLEYDRLLDSYPEKKKLIDAIFRTMTDTLAHKEIPAIKISGCTYCYNEIEEAFDQLGYEHIEYIIKCIDQSGKAIKSPTKYILQCLLQANTKDIYEISRNQSSKGNAFNQFMQNEYDYDALEAMLLEN